MWIDVCYIVVMEALDSSVQAEASAPEKVPEEKKANVGSTIPLNG